MHRSILLETAADPGPLVLSMIAMAYIRDTSEVIVVDRGEVVLSTG